MFRVKKGERNSIWVTLTKAGLWQIQLVLAGLLIVSLLTNLWGIRWGLPGLWHFDEKLGQVLNMLEAGTLSPPRFNHPSLPLYVMLITAKITQFLGGTTFSLIAVRIISALLGTATIGLTYLMMRACRRDGVTALLAPLLATASTGLVITAHFATVDIYLTFFVTLSIWLLQLYVATGRRLWFLVAAVTIGLAASSKYNGAILLVPAAISVLLIHRQQTLLALLTVLFAGAVLMALAFFVGTPFALLDTHRFVRDVVDVFSIQHHYAGPAQIGLIGQRAAFLDALGKPLAIIFLIGTVLAALITLRELISGDERNKNRARAILVVILVLIIFDIPISITTFYPMRFIVPMIPGLAVLTAISIQELWQLDGRPRWGILRVLVGVGLVGVLAFSYIRVIGIELLFINDARIAAGEWLANGLPANSSVEYTRLQPNFPDGRYRLQEFPYSIRRHPSDPVPLDDLGLAGVEMRRPDYLVVTSYMYWWYYDNPYFCELNLANCIFFRGLLAGKTAYDQAAHFHYELPQWLPTVSTLFVNPDIYVFARREEDYPAEEAIALLNQHAFSMMKHPPPDLWVNLGQAYAEHGQEDEAIEVYQEALRLAPTNYWANHLLAQTLFDRGQWQEVVALEQMALRGITADELHVESLKLMSRAYLNEGDLASACRALKETTKYGTPLEAVNKALAGWGCT